MPIETLFLDAGGVLVHPSWRRVSEALKDAGIDVSSERLRDAEPHAMRVLDEATIVGATDDHKRGWMYFNLILEQVGVELSPRTDEALEVLRAYHMEQNLWEHVEPDVVPALASFRQRGCASSWSPMPTGDCAICSNGSTWRAGSTPSWTRTNGASRSRIRGCSSSPWPKSALRRRARCTSATCTTSTWPAPGGRPGARGSDHAASLYDGVDCPRIARLDDLNAWLDATAVRA